MIVDPPGAASIVVIAAHPDDMESWCAGTLARACEAGATVRLLLVTAGDKGSDNPADTAVAVAQRRVHEARDAARLLGLAEVAVLGYPDGEVEDTRTLRGQLVAALRRWRPDVLFTHDPERPYPPYLTHRDHRVVGRAALDAAYPLARDRLSFPEHAAAGLAPHAVRAIWLFSSERPTAYVDISASVERKVAARLVHVSQTRAPDALRTRWRERAARIGRAPPRRSLRHPRPRVAAWHEHRSVWQHRRTSPGRPIPQRGATSCPRRDVHPRRQSCWEMGQRVALRSPDACHARSAPGQKRLCR